MSTNADLLALLEKGRSELAATTISYPEWQQRVASGYYGQRHIDPMSGTAWGRALAYLDEAVALLQPPLPTRVLVSGEAREGATLTAALV